MSKVILVIVYNEDKDKIRTRKKTLAHDYLTLIIMDLKHKFIYILKIIPM